MNIYSQNIYEISENEHKKFVLILYNIYNNHYVGLTIHATKQSNDFIYIKSINKFIDINDLQEYSRKNIKRISLC